MDTLNTQKAVAQGLRSILIALFTVAIAGLAGYGGGQALVEIGRARSAAVMERYRLERLDEAAHTDVVGQQSTTLPLCRP